MYLSYVPRCLRFARHRWCRTVPRGFASRRDRFALRPYAALSRSPLSSCSRRCDCGWTSRRDESAAPGADHSNRAAPVRLRRSPRRRPPASRRRNSSSRRSRTRHNIAAPNALRHERSGLRRAGPTLVHRLRIDVLMRDARPLLGGLDTTFLIRNPAGRVDHDLDQGWEVTEPP